MAVERSIRLLDPLVAFDPTYMFAFGQGVAPGEAFRALPSQLVNLGLSAGATGFQLGQAVGAAGDPALVDADIEIPFNALVALKFNYSGATPADTQISIAPNLLKLEGHTTNLGVPSLQLIDNDTNDAIEFQKRVGATGWLLANSHPFLVQDVLGIGAGSALNVAWVDIAASTAARAGLRLQLGQLKTVPVSGCFEHFEDFLYFTTDSVRKGVMIAIDGVAPPVGGAAVALTNYIGISGAIYLGEPFTWGSVFFNGNQYKIPLYQ